MILAMSATLTACSSSSVPETPSSVFEESTNQSETFSITSSEEPSSQSESDETITESSVVESLQSPSEAFISDVSAAISGSVTTGKESISGINLENRDLHKGCIRIRFTIIISALKACRMPVINALPFKKSAEKLKIPLISAFSFSTTINKNRIFCLTAFFQKQDYFL